MIYTLKSDQSLKTTIRLDAELRLPIWHCGMCKAFFMHVSSALNAIKKQSTFKAYKEAHEAYVEQREVAKQAKATLALLLAPRLLQRNPLRRRRLPRRPRKVQLWPMHQPQNFVTSTRPSLTRPPLQKRPPRTSAKLLLPRCFSSMQTCCL